MTADESTNDLVAVMPDNVIAMALPATHTCAEVRTPEEQAKFEQAEIERGLQRIEQFPREFGWLLVYVGVLGIVLPGIIGFPFVIAGGAVLMPGGRKRLARWAGRNPGRLVRASLRQITRMADDIDRRYPSVPGASS